MYRFRDVKGVGMCSWTDGAESGMDNGVRFINASTVKPNSTVRVGITVLVCSGAPQDACWLVAALT